MRWPSTVLVLANVLLVASLAAAQETGSVSGGIFDRTGAPIAGATVRISTDASGVERTMVTSEKGTFGFVLPPGDYKVEVEKAGVGQTSRAIVLELGRETRADFILGALVAEPVAVTATMAPDVDLKSTEVNFNYRRAVVQDLPLERTYLGLMQLIPGVAENNGFAPNGGGSRQDNTFLLDSVNITNPFFGYLSTEVNELDIAEIDVKRGAIRPEFGRSTGLISNALIKSGTNRFTGTYRFEAIPSQWITGSTKIVRSRTDRWDNAIAAGGPIVKNRLFYYASVNVFRSASPGAENIFGPIPNRVEKTNESFGKITARVGGRHVINGGYRHRPTRIDFAGIGAYDAPEVASNVRATNRIGNVNYDWFAGSRTTASIKYVHVDERNSSVAVRDLGFQPPFNSFNPGAMGRVVLGGLTVGAASLRLNRQNYSRDEIKGVVSHFVDAGRTSHQIKVGVGWDEGTEDLTRRSNGWGDISHVFVGGVERVRATYYPEQPPQRSTGRTYALFGQDDITLGSRLTINAGVLLNRDEFVQTTSSSLAASGTTPSMFPTFGFGDEIQPRVGVILQVRKGQGDKAYANWGRYYGLDQKSGARAAASGRLYTEDADFDLITSTLIERTVSANTGAKTIASNLQPPVTDEIVLGYATPLSDGWSLDAFFLSRRSDRFIEDVPTVLPFSSFQFQNDPYAVRKYRTVTVELKRRLQDRWFMNLSYAWSKLSGNYDQDYSGDFLNPAILNTASLIDDGPGAFTSDRFRYGLLSQDRTHLYKILATWMPKQIDGLSVGVFVRGQSGTPWEARGLPWNSSTTYLRLLEPAGTNRNPFWTNVDQLLKYTVELKEKRALHIEGRILNVFNQETVLLVDQRKSLDPRVLTIVGTPPPDCWSCFTEAFPQGVAQLNGKLGQPIAYARPRRLLLSVLFDF
jgi:hypothetical protein